MKFVVIALLGLWGNSPHELSARLATPDAPTIASSVVSIETTTGSGTGFVVAPGLVLTANHVVDRGAQSTVVHDAVRRSGRVVRRDEGFDLALVEVDGLGLPSLGLAGSDPAVLAEVFVFGNPLGNPLSVSRGIVSAVTNKRIQTDAAINPGNSGGPMVDDGGKVVGLVVSKERDAEGLGFAVPVGRLRSFVDLANDGGKGSPSVTTDPPKPPAPATPAPPALGDESPGDESPEEKRGDGFPLLPALGGVLAAAGIASVVSIAVIRRRKKERIVVTAADVDGWLDVPMPNKPPTAPETQGRIVLGAEFLKEEGNQ